MKRAVCTIVTKSHIAYARAMAHQLGKFHPDIPLFVLVADSIENYLDPGDEPFRLIQLSQLKDQEAVLQMSRYYSAFEFCTALRPHFHEFMYRSAQCERWIYMDSDIYIAAGLNAIFDKLEEFCILLSPHSFSPDLDAEPVEETYLKYGVFNGGFLGLRSDDQTEKFLSWLKQRLRFHCLEDSHCFVDQAWLNLVPIFFDGVGLLRHAGTNISFWNLHEREFRQAADGSWLVNDQPLLFLHFSGGDFVNRKQVFKSDKKFRGPVPPAVVDYFSQYVDLLFASGHAETSQWPYQFGFKNNGEVITKEQRRAERHWLLTAHRQSQEKTGILRRLGKRFFS